jgi:hypothetical protein
LLTIAPEEAGLVGYAIGIARMDNQRPAGAESFMTNVWSADRTGYKHLIFSIIDTKVLNYGP